MNRSLEHELICDPFDPRTWPEPEPYARVWLDPQNGLFCVVDWDDYQWALAWLWSAHESKTKGKFYASRTSGGMRVYLHKSILLRALGEPPTPAHTIGDHKNGNSLDDRRSNLRWATPQMNARNRYGYFALQSEFKI